MPSSRLLNAASTELDDEAWPEAPVLFGFCTVGGVVGDVSVSVDFVVVGRGGTGVAFGTTVRSRVDCVFDEFVFWAKATPALASAIKATVRNLFNIG
jgi:hypothetical protein